MLDSDDLLTALGRVVREREESVREDMPVIPQVPGSNERLVDAVVAGLAQGDPDVLKEWAHLIALFALRAGDTAAAKKLVDRILSRDQQRTIFHRTFGSFHLHMWLKRLRSILDPRSA